VGPTAPVPQTIHQQAIIQQISASSTNLRDMLLALTLAPTNGLMSTLTCILGVIPTDKEHPPTGRWIHYTPRVASTLDQLQLTQQTHISSTQNHLEIIFIHPPRFFRKTMRIRHLADLRLSFRHLVFTQICPTTHLHLRQQWRLEQGQQTWA
jgi:hypothetical protein